MQYRTSRSQTFLNPNDSFTTKLYPIPVFYRDASGHWQPINNSLTPNNASKFTNQAGPLHATFPQTLANGAAIAVSPGGNPNEFEMSLIGETETAPATVKGNSISYPNVHPGVDLSYAMQADHVKESIILHSATAPTTFSFLLHAPGITFSQLQDGSIVGKNAQGNSLYTIPAPFMTDAHGAMSKAVTSALSTNSRGDTVLTVSANATWLADPARAYPVTIDPSVSVTPIGSNVMNSSIASGYPTASYDSDSHLYVGYASGYDILRGLVEFQDLPNLLAGGTSATITNASLYLYQDSASTGGLAVQVLPITQSWQPSSVSYNQQPSVGSVLDTESQATSDVSSSSPYVGDWVFNVTSAIQSEYADQSPNFGLELRAQNESSATTDAWFASGYNATEPLPSLNITYTVNPVGSDAAWMHSSDGVNYAGGNLSLPFVDLNTPGRGPEVSITRTFNSKNLSVNEGFGNGWSSNVLMHLNVSSLPGPILFTDATGAVHVLAPTGVNTWADAGSEHETLTQNSNGTFTLSQLDGMTLQFTSTGQLSAIQQEEQNGSTQSVTFGYTGNQLSTITDASGRTWQVTYNSSGLISQITDPSSRTATYSYDASGNLTSAVTSPASGTTGDVTSTTSYAYSSTSPELTVTDPDGNQTNYDWNSSGVVSSVSRTVEGTTATTSYAWGTVPSGQTDAGDEEVTVTDPVGHTSEYVTNADGNVVETIVNPGGSPSYTTTYTWDGNNDLTGITDPNGHSVQALYNSNGDLTQFTDARGVTSNYAYGSLDNAKGANTSNGATTHAAYNGTLVTDGIDAAGNDTMVTYDQSGNPTAVTAPEGLGNNLIPNSDFAQVDSTTSLPVDWENATSGVTVDTNAADAIRGSTSLEINATTAASDRMSQSIAVTAGETYNLSAYIRTSGVTNDQSGYGAGISAFWLNSSGALVSAQYAIMNSTGTVGWTRKYAELTAPAGATQLQLSSALYGAGIVWFDGMQLEPVASSPNLLLNTSFADNPSGSVMPENWDTSTLQPGSDGLDLSNEDNGFPSLLVNGDGAAKSFSQTVNAPQYVIGGFLLSGSSKQSGATANYTVTATVTYTDTTTSSMSLTFSDTASGWQTQSVPVPVTSGKTIQSVTVTGDFSNESTGSQAWFNDIKLRVLPQLSSFSAYNFVQNPGFAFNYQGGTLPDDWKDLQTGTGTPSWSQTESYDAQGHSLEIHPGTSGSTEEVANDGLAPYKSYAHYAADGYIHTEGLASDSAYIALQALSSSGGVLATYPSGKVGHSQANSQGNVPWTHVIVDVPAAQLPNGTVSVRVVLCQDADVSGGSGNGNSYFDDIRLSSWDLSTHYAYDSADNYVTSVTDPNGNTTTFTPNANTGFDTSVTDPLGYQTTYTSNKFDETTGTTLPTGATFSYGYDANGNLTSVSDPNGHAVQYAYNALSQVTQYTETVGGTALTTGFHHNGDGQMTEIDNPNTTSTTFGYNAAGQLDSTSYYNSAGLADQWGFSYDGVGNLTQMQENTATSPTTYGYDPNNHLTSVSEPVSGGGADTQQWTLDPSGNPTSIHYQLGSSTGPSWTLSNAYDIASRLTSLQDGNRTQSFEYDDHGNVVKITDEPTGEAQYAQSESFTYDPADHISHVVSLVSNTDLSYTDDADGRVTKITNNLTGASVTFTYNAIGELTQETTWDGRTITYGYDSDGNRTSMSVTQNGTTTTTNYGYDPEQNRLTSITTGSNAAQSVTYDNAGNTLSDGTNTYTWNAANELASVTHAATTYNYTYDGLGRRVTANGDTYHYNGLSDQIAYITDANNNLVARFSYGANGLPAYMTMVSGGSTYVYRYIYDGQGDVIGLVDVTTGSATVGQEVVTYGYDAWGNEIPSLTTDTSGTNAGTINPFTYRGYVYDSQTGLYYLNARYYNPATGRFLSEDTVSPNPNSALSYNEYAYTANNPVNLVDPTGDWWWNNPVIAGEVAGFGTAEAGEAAIPVIGWAAEPFTFVAEAGTVTITGYLLAKSPTIPTKLTDGSGNVDLGKFNQRVKGGTSYKNPDTGWQIDKDTAGHGGSQWKLKNPQGGRVASLDANGKVLRK